ncbi:MAG: hypothetical protein ABFS56_28520 [Pseudomonadota bacterium]
MQAPKAQILTSPCRLINPCSFRVPTPERAINRRRAVGQMVLVRGSQPDGDGSKRLCPLAILIAFGDLVGSECEMLFQD